MKKILSFIAASAFVSVSGLASAAEPTQLTESQMDVVSAGATSTAEGFAFALFGNTTSASNAGTSQTAILPPLFVNQRTWASTEQTAEGVVAVTASSATASL